MKQIPGLREGGERHGGIAHDNAGAITRDDFFWNGTPQIQRSLHGLKILTQRVPRGPRGADEPRAIAEPAGCDGNGS
jgi:hypothetical protein